MAAASSRALWKGHLLTLSCCPNRAYSLHSAWVNPGSGGARGYRARTRPVAGPGVSGADPASDLVAHLDCRDGSAEVRAGDIRRPDTLLDRRVHGRFDRGGFFGQAE